MLDDTLVIFGGEFGRTIYSQGKLTPTDYGRDHHPRCFSIWAAGGGIKGGVVHGETDEFSYNIVKDPVHVRDFQATLLHCFGIDHERFSYLAPGLGSAADGRGTGPSGEGDSGVAGRRSFRRERGEAGAGLREVRLQADRFAERGGRRPCGRRGRRGLRRG
jgi:hypothetical protein